MGGSAFDPLPDDVLILILSFLTLAEAVRTSILSRRWKNLWHYNPSLDFDATTVLSDRLEDKSDWYISWVNKVLEGRLAVVPRPSVKKFRIHYALNACHGRHIDKWVNFAVTENVEILHLDLSESYGSNILPKDQCKLTNGAWHRAPSEMSNTKCLKSLDLTCVDVTKQFIEFIISCCPLLEHLALYYAGSFKDLKIISGTTPLKLRRLLIATKEDFSLLKLCAPNLVSLDYHGPKFSPHKVDVPKLIELSVGSLMHSPPLLDYLKHFWCYFPQLVKLELKMAEAQKLWLKEIPRLIKLKHLKITVFWHMDLICGELIALMQACPLLETFVLLVYDKICLSSRPDRRPLDYYQEYQGEQVPFECLKVLELCGGDGGTVDLKLVQCIIKNAPNLEKFIVDPRSQGKNNSFLPAKPKVCKAAKEKANKLGKLLPYGAKIIVRG